MSAPTVLVIGSGAREHALVSAIARSPQGPRVVAAPGNDGMAEAERRPVDANDPAAVVALAKDLRADLVVVGPEEPLVGGVVDALEAAGLAALGPSKAAARLEGSKAFMKAIADKAGAPTAAYAVFEDETSALAHLETVGAPIVVKADGLAAGKGVVVAEDAGAAEAAIRDCFAGRFGRAGARVVLEERMTGPEVSAFVLADGTGATVWLGDAQDYKRLLDGDEGPNTGGMGAYSPAPVLTDALRAETLDRIIRPTLDAMATEGAPFKGFLFCGLMLTPDGVKLLEFNVRFGDPEAQVLLPRMEGDVLALLQAAAEGRLEGAAPFTLAPGATLGVVLAAPGYPVASEKGQAIGGLDDAGRPADPVDDVTIVHAATRRGPDGWTAEGGRVLTVVGTADTLETARAKAYEAVRRIDWPQAHYRRDIGVGGLSALREGTGA